jgi:hypothetical protein
MQEKQRYCIMLSNGITIYEVSMTFLISDIKEINKSKIIYVDCDNKLKEIDLLECSKNWVEHFNSHEYITWDRNPAPKITVQNNDCVGERDWFDEKPYYEFYTDPKIRFELHPKKRFIDRFRKHWNQRYYPEFHKVSIDLEKAGWSTFDLG